MPDTFLPSPLSVFRTSLTALALGACGDAPLRIDRGTAATDADSGPSATSGTNVDTVNIEDADETGSETGSDSGPRIDDRPTLDATTSELPAPPEGTPLGGDRPARIVLPTNYDPSRAFPLVMLLHGYSVTGAIQDVYLEFSAKASAAGWLVIVPDGTHDIFGFPFWNSDPAWCCNFAHAAVDDVAYLSGLIAEARARYHVDPEHIAVFGHSNGGFMAHRLACEGTGGVTAVAALAGSLPSKTEDCHPPRPVSALQIHGTLDLVIEYGGVSGSYPGAEIVAQRWQLYDSCKGTPTMDPGAKDYDLTALGAETHAFTSASCAAGTTVALWRLEASGHLPVPMPDFVPDALTWLGTHGTTAALGAAALPQ